MNENENERECSKEHCYNKATLGADLCEQCIDLKDMRIHATYDLLVCGMTEKAHHFFNEMVKNKLLVKSDWDDIIAMCDIPDYLPTDRISTNA
jgi:pentatricopeptide repeat protein